MNQERARWALLEVARRHGVDEGHVRSEIEKAIAEAMKNPESREVWEKIPSEGEVPTPEELTAFLASEMRKRLMD
jgi:tripartite-type tricarboxylate transporter receptor subunit TctC